MGPGGPVGLNMLAVKDAMKDHHIDPDEYILFSTQTRHIANIVISEQYAEADRKAKQKNRGH